MEHMGNDLYIFIYQGRMYHSRHRKSWNCLKENSPANPGADFSMEKNPAILTTAAWFTAIARVSSTGLTSGLCHGVLGKVQCSFAEPVGGFRLPGCCWSCQSIAAHLPKISGLGLAGGPRHSTKSLFELVVMLMNLCMTMWVCLKIHGTLKVDD